MCSIPVRRNWRGCGKDQSGCIRSHPIHVRAGRNQRDKHTIEEKRAVAGLVHVVDPERSSHEGRGPRILLGPVVFCGTV